MSLYVSFNKWVYNYYINYCIPNQLNSLSIPSSEIDEFVIANAVRLDSFEEVNSDSWSNLLKKKETIPQYFGLIALQCLAAFKMQNEIDRTRTESNYRNHFADIVGLSNVNDFNKFSSESFNLNLNVQEAIWLNAVDYLKLNYINISIPQIRAGKGRYVQFPISQIILNYEDLKEYIFFLKSINHEFESISFEDFKRYYTNRISEFRKSFRRNNNIKSDNQWSDIERKIKIKQIFDYYCSEDWEIANQKENDKGNSTDKNYIIKLYDNKLLLFDSYHQKLENLNSLIMNQQYMIFKENKEYPNEYESVNSISLSDNSIFIIFNSPANANKIKALKNVFPMIHYENISLNILLFKIIDSNQLPDFLKNKVISDYPIELKGFKVSGQKKYFVNHPPKICLKKEIHYQIYYNKKRISRDEIKEIGKYTIKINGYSNYNFELIETPSLDYASNLKNKPLLFSSLNYDDKDGGSINGLKIEYVNSIKMELLTINNWISSLAGKKNNSKNQLLKSISKSRNGKQYN